MDILARSYLLHNLVLERLNRAKIAYLERMKIQFKIRKPKCWYGKLLDKSRVKLWARSKKVLFKKHQRHLLGKSNLPMTVFSKVVLQKEPAEFRHFSTSRPPMSCRKLLFRKDKSQKVFLDYVL